MTPEQTAAPTTSPPETPFYGWRYINRTLPDGSVTMDCVPLTLEDVLHPQEGDQIPERPRHQQDRDYVADAFETRLPGLDRGEVLSDCLVDWNVPGIRNHSPDVSAFEEVDVPHDPDKGTFRVAVSGGRCLVAVELVSPDTRSNDVTHKLREYHTVGVPLYVIIDQEREGGPRKLLAYEHRPEGYVLLPLNERGRIEIPRLGLCLGLEDNWVVCYDTVTGEKLERYPEAVEAGKKAARKAAEEAEARTKAEEKARTEAEARTKAEEKARTEAEARTKAEEKARTEAEARTKAEDKTRKEAEAKKKAQGKARKEAQARKAAEEKAGEEAAAREKAEKSARDAEARLQALEAELRRLRGEEKT